MLLKLTSTVGAQNCFSVSKGQGRSILKQTERHEFQLFRALGIMVCFDTYFDNLVWIFYCQTTPVLKELVQLENLMFVMSIRESERLIAGTPLWNQICIKVQFFLSKFISVFSLFPSGWHWMSITNYWNRNWNGRLMLAKMLPSLFIREKKLF